ncbi:hypothetical protein CHS0354_042374 [Potamilus streckersoni]|uniref:Uncharacterized protein n=1 Tax=Potamilus streckersoni TaxID=2493646 RepID=A0AAE0SU07_9BIVA|nr:hypothetical protein CHS0354_042374 [Potamilus streckersoni]
MTLLYRAKNKSVCIYESSSMISYGRRSRRRSRGYDKFKKELTGQGVVFDLRKDRGPKHSETS